MPPTMPAAKTSQLALSARDQAWLVYQAMEQSDDIVLLLEESGADAVVTGCNAAFRRASGFTEDQIRGRPVAALFPGAGNAATLLNAIHSRLPLHTEMACARAGGGTCMLDLHLMAAQIQGSDRFAFVILGCDITASLGARQMQDSVQGLLATVFICIDEAVVIVDDSGRILMTNPQTDRLLGYRPNALVGRNTLDLVAPWSRAATAATRQHYIELGTQACYSVPLLKADGSELPARVTSVPVEREGRKRFRILTLRSARPEPPALRIESAGRIRLVGLEEVRTALGARWPAAAERAMATAEAVLKRRCGPRDSFSRVDETSFLICFGETAGVDASFRAAMIGREIRERLIGQGNAPETAFVRAIAAAVACPRGSGETAETMRASLLDGLDAQLQHIEQQARQTLRAAIAGATCDVEPLRGRNPEDRTGGLVCLPETLERQITCALASLPQQESEAFDLDGLLLGLAAKHAIAALASGDTNPILVALRFEVFRSRSATERYIVSCQKLDRRVASRLVFLLTGLPEGLPRTRLLEWINRLRPFCRGVGFQLDDLTRLSQVDLSHSDHPIIAMPATALAGLSRDRVQALATSLHARRASLLVLRVRTEDEAAVLLSAGADMISMQRPMAGR